MVIDPVPYRIGGATKWLMSCDWPDCNEQFYAGGNPAGLHYCPEVHRSMNKVAVTVESQKRLRQGIRTRGTEQDRRLVLKKYERAWMPHTPHCPVCGEEISLTKDCLCP